jgi:F0F1-type ATP synthase assembly protein I
VLLRLDRESAWLGVLGGLAIAAIPALLFVVAAYVFDLHWLFALLAVVAVGEIIRLIRTRL